MKTKQRSKWRKFTKTPKNGVRQYLVRTDTGKVMLGTFYCGVFVRDAFSYHEWAGVECHVTHYQPAPK